MKPQTDYESKRVLLIQTDDKIYSDKMILLNRDYAMFYKTQFDTLDNYFYIGDFRRSETSSRLSQLINVQIQKPGIGTSESIVSINDLLIQASPLTVNTTKLSTQAPSFNNCMYHGALGCVYCALGYLLGLEGSCIKRATNDPIFETHFSKLAFSCGENEYMNKDISICQTCPDDCYQCLDFQTCVIKQKDCFDINCNKCANANLTQCLECRSGFHLNKTKLCEKCSTINCISCSLDSSTCDHCERGFYLSPENKSCKQCHSSCQDCVNTSEQCSSCYPSFYLDVVTEKCLALGSMTYKHSLIKVKRRCELGCSKCNDNNECVRCGADFVSLIRNEDYRFQNYKFECLLKCPSTHFLAIIQIESTSHSICIDCSEKVANCVQCIPYLQSATLSVHCLVCKSGFFPKINSAKNFEQECRKCEGGCVTCADSPSNCTSCPDSQELSYDSVNQKVI